MRKLDDHSGRYGKPNHPRGRAAREPVADRSTRSCFARTTTITTRRATISSARRRRSTVASSGWTLPARMAGACITARSCPGFPQHPHRGFETVTIVRHGLHRSLRFARRDRALRPRRRAVADRGQGNLALRDVSARRADAPNPTELFQIWLNLPAKDKIVAPHFTMFWDRDIPRIEDAAAPW